MSKDVQSVGERAEAICGAEANTQGRVDPAQELVDRIGQLLEGATAFLDAWIVIDDDLLGALPGRDLQDTAPTGYCDGLRDMLAAAESDLQQLHELDMDGERRHLAWFLMIGVRDLLLRVACSDARLSVAGGLAIKRLLADIRDGIQPASDSARGVVQ